MVISNYQFRENKIILKHVLWRLRKSLVLTENLHNLIKNFPIYDMQVDEIMDY